MEPGHGAEIQASRRARRLERLRREAAASGRADARVAEQIAAEQRRLRAWSAGAEGERMVAAALESLAPYGWTALHDVRWPGRPVANIDHIAIGPGGVVVIDAKNWSGDVTVVDGDLKQNGYSRSREAENVASMTSAVAAILAPQHRTAAVGMICLASTEMPLRRLPTGAGVVGRLQLAETLVRIKPRLTPYDVADIGRFLARELGTPPTPVRHRPSGSNRRRPRRDARYASTPRRSAARTPRRRATSASPIEALVRLGLTVGGLLVFWSFLTALLRDLGSGG